MTQQKSIKKNFVMNMILTVSGFIFPIISFPYVSRVLGPSGTGRVDFAASIIGYFSIFSQLGIPTYGIRACARVRDDKAELSRTVYELLLVNVIMTALTFILLVPTIFFVPKFNSDISLYFISSLCLLFNAIGIEYLYRGLENYSYITIRSIVFKVIAFISLFALVKVEEDYLVYAGISIFASSASNVMNFIHSQKYLQRIPVRSLRIRRHLKPVLMFFAMSCATTIYLNLDRAMLGFLKDDTEVGYYGAAVKIKNIMLSVVTSLGTVLLPRASYYVERGMKNEFKKITTKALKFVFISAVPITVYFVVFAREGMLMVSGAEYLPAVPAMQVIMPTLVFIGITNILGIQILLPLGKEKHVLYSEIAGAIIDLVLNAFLIPTLGATGAAIGTLVAELVVLVVQCGLLHKIYDENPIIDSFRRISYWKLVIAIVISFACSFWIKSIHVNYFSRFSIKASLVELLNNGTLVLLSGLVFFGTYYIAMLLLRDDMVIEITGIITTKIKSISLRMPKN